MSSNDEKKTLARRDAGARDFIFPAKDYFLACYATVDGNEMYFKTIRGKRKPDDKKRYMKLYVDSSDSIIVSGIEDKKVMPAEVLFRLNDSGDVICRRDIRKTWNDHIGMFQEFDRMGKYESYLKFRGSRRRAWWCGIPRSDLPKTFLCDAMRGVFGQRRLIWSWPDVSLLMKGRHENVYHVNYRAITDWSRTFFPDCLYSCSNEYLFSLVNHDRFSRIKQILGLEYRDPMLYRMGVFHDLSNENVYFIGTFEPEIAPNSSFTTIISYNFHQDRLAIENKFGHQGKILGFRVHIDSPPIVDQISKCAVVLSVSDPEILVICLKTFSYLRIDLQRWATDGFIERWERDKRRICMTFLSNCSKLVLFPRYPQDYYKKVPGDFLPKSTLLDWTRVKDKVITPFLEAKREI